MQSTIPGTVDTQDAVQQCADYSFTGSNGQVGINSYASFQLYYLNDQDDWICRAYYKQEAGGTSDDSDPSYFNVPNVQAAPAVGF